MMDPNNKNDNDNYRSFHESLTSNNNGTTAIESTLVILPSIISLFVLALIHSLQRENTMKRPYFFQYCLEFFIIIMPCVMCFTIMADHLVLVYLIYFITCIVLLRINHVPNYAGVTQYLRKIQSTSTEESYFYRSDQDRRSYITNFRAITNMLTVLCILAVDFNSFPRRFAKTETFGFGVMDFGVGLFIVGNALVQPEAHFKVSPPISKISLQCIPMVVLGVVRLILTNLVEYHEHVTEYGRHWNFFFTLAVTKLVSSIILKVIKSSKHLYIASSTLIILHETVLQCGLQKWILSDAPRLDFVSANREGIVSIGGYIALYFAGVCLGRILNRSDKLNPAQNVVLGKELSKISFFSWVLTYVCQSKFGVSRRLANAGYLFWMISFTTTVLVCLLVIEYFSLYLKFKNVSSKRVQPNPNVTFVPNLLEAINTNGLTFFVLANLLTGFVNLQVKTFYLGTFPSVIILVLYMNLNCITVSYLHFKKIKFL